MDELLQKINKINFNISKYTTPQEVENYLLTKEELNCLLERNKGNRIFSKGFLKENVILDFVVDIDGLVLNENWLQESYLLKYLFLETGRESWFNFLTCSCGYPECGGFNGIPYVIFTNGSQTLIQMLLEKERGYGEVIEKIKEKNIIHNQSFTFEKIVHSSINGVSKIKSFSNSSEEQILLTFNFNDFITFRNKIINVIRKGKNIITYRDLAEEIFIYGDEKFNPKQIQNSLKEYGKITKVSIKKRILQKKISKKIRNSINKFLQKNNLKQEILFGIVNQKDIEVFIDEGKYSGAIESCETSLYSLIFEQVFNQDLYLNRDIKGELKILKNWKKVEESVILFLSKILSNVLKNNKIIQEKLFETILVSDRRMLQRWIKGINFNNLTEEEEYLTLKSVVLFFEDYINDNQLVKEKYNFTGLDTFEELVLLFDNILKKEFYLISLLNKETYPDWMKNGRRFTIIC